jgi:pSer/pThr/pTyr-binding forkhead associated (FHA) protein
MEQCPQCGAQTRPDDNFCLFCGSPLGGRMDSNTPAMWSGGQRSSRPSISGAMSPVTLDPANGAQSDLRSEDRDHHPPASSATQMGAVNGQPAQSVSPHAFLVIASLPGRPRVPLDKPEMCIGRLQRSDIVLPNDKLVSRRHAMIQAKEGVFTLFDLGSSNGTFVNGHELFAPLQLHHGDRINIGEHELIFQILEQCETVALSHQHYETVPVARESPEDGDARPLQTPVVSSFQPIAVQEGVPQKSEAASLLDEGESAGGAAASSEREQPLATVAPASPVTPAITRTFAQEGVAADLIARIRTLLPEMDAIRQQSQGLSQALEDVTHLIREHDEALTKAAALRDGIAQVAAQLLAVLQPIEQFHASADYSQITGLVARLIKQPRDIEVLAELARQVAALEQLLTIHQQLRQAVETCRVSLTQLLQI